VEGGSDRKRRKEARDAALKTVTVVIKGDTFTLKSGDKVVEEVTVAVDATKKPKHVTLTPVKGPRKGKSHLGIYAVEKDRPTEFATTAESGSFLIVLQPAKP
jgi:uncharacterized protein (TIGR03067 family)